MEALRYIPLPLTVLSLFIFPWSVTLIGMALSGLAYPLSALALGIAADLLYYPGEGVLLGTVWGIGLTALAYAVRYFVKERML